VANVENGNSVYIDSTGQVTDTGKPALVSYIVFTTTAANDELILKDDDTNGSLKIAIKHATADDTVMYDFSSKPIFFPNGIYCSTISTGATATLIGDKR
jgi:hypothetical protein